MSLIWSGRIFIDEKVISEEQYNVFFSEEQNIIPLGIANEILRDRTNGIFGRIVPVDSLKPEYIELIHKQVFIGGLSEGIINSNEQILHWKWTPSITQDGTKLEFSDLSTVVLSQILESMAKENSRWGIIQKIIN